MNVAQKKSKKDVEGSADRDVTCLQENATIVQSAVFFSAIRVLEQKAEIASEEQRPIFMRPH